MSFLKNNELINIFYLFKKSFLTIGVFSGLVNLLLLTPTFYMLQLYDRVLSSGSMPTLVMLTLIMLVLMGAMGGLEWVRSRIMVRLSVRLDQALSVRVHDASFAQTLSPNGGPLAAQSLNDLAGLRQFLTGNGLFAFFDAPWLPVYLAVMFVLHPLLGWMGVASAITLVVLMLANERFTKSLLNRATQAQGQAGKINSQSLRNAELVQAMGMQSTLRQRWLQCNEEALVWLAMASDRAGGFSALSKTFRQVVQSLVLGVGAYLVLEQQVTPGVMLAGSILLGRALAPIDQMIGSWKGFVLARGQFERLSRLLNSEPKAIVPMALPEPKGLVELEKIQVLAPHSGKPLLLNVGFTVQPGQLVAVIGPSGAGKSTLAKVLMGVWPVAVGHMRLDGAELQQWDRQQLGRYLGYLPQDIELFDGTIGENIARMGTVDAQSVVQAAQLAGVHELILRLPQGYETRVGRGGVTLSGGQRQRIGLARAVYRQPKLVVLDEPNSNLDDEGESMLLKALQHLKNLGSTVFVITHRQSLLRYVDKVLVMHVGTVALFGDREYVLSQLKTGAASASASLGLKKVSEQ